MGCQTKPLGFGSYARAFWQFTSDPVCTPRKHHIRAAGYVY